MPRLAAPHALLPLLLTLAVPGLHAKPPAVREVPAADALLLLVDGNRRFVTDQSVHFQQDAQRRHVTARQGQRPHTVVLTCSDSRVPPELIFDQGLGCLFVVRVAGNVARPDEVASVEYGVAHLGARLVLVLGHTHCGAVTAVVENASVGPNLAQLVEPIGRAAARAAADHPDLQGAPLVAAAVRANVEQALADLTRLSPELALAADSGQLRLVGALYDLESGEVRLLDPAASRPPPENLSEWAPRPAPAPPARH